jgi:hypothetical protein
VLAAASQLAPRLSIGMESGFFTAIVFMSLLLHQQGRHRGAGVAAALAAVTRPEGLLLLLVLLLHRMFACPDKSMRPRLLDVARAAAPSVALLGTVWAFELYYFGSVVPESIRAKSHFGCEISGCFAPAAFGFLLVQYAGSFETIVLLAGAGLGICRALLSRDRRDHVLFLWGGVYLVAFTVGRAPDSPWYYAPLVPIMFASLAYGLEGAASCVGRRVRFGGPIVLALTFGFVAFLAVPADWVGERDPDNEKRQLVSAVLSDMERRDMDSARILAFEVGYIAYTVPGRVYDLLGLVTPGFQPCLTGEDGNGVLRRLQPDYVLVIDEGQFLATGCIHRSAVLAGEFRTILTLPRVFGHNYLVYARR